MNSFPPPTTAPAGWYPDPYGGGRRYFDGREWVGPAFPDTAAAFAPKEEHPTLPVAAAIGALAVLTTSLIVTKVIVEALVGNDWPLVVYITIASVLSYGPSVAWGLHVRRRWGAGRFASIGWKARWSDLGWGPLTWLTAIVAQATVALLIIRLDVPFTSNIDAGGPGTDDRDYVIALLVAAVIAAPIIEEMVFRGLVLRGFLSRMHVAVAIPLQGILFGAAHFDPVRGTGNIGLIAVLSAVGMVLGGSAYLTRRLGAPMLAHAILNGVALALVLTGALDGVESPFEHLLRLVVA